ncbi:hypothetical protein P7C70_g925, partial [Phenoliferia sp. Uapishka_3]
MARLATGTTSLSGNWHCLRPCALRTTLVLPPKTPPRPSSFHSAVLSPLLLSYAICSPNQYFESALIRHAPTIGFLFLLLLLGVGHHRVGLQRGYLLLRGTTPDPGCAGTHADKHYSQPSIRKTLGADHDSGARTVQRPRLLPFGLQGLFHPIKVPSSPPLATTYHSLLSFHRFPPSSTMPEPFPLNADCLHRVLELVSESNDTHVFGSIVKWQTSPPSSIAPFALVSRKWRDPTNRILYRSVVLDNSTRASRFVETSLHRPDLTRQTRAISLNLTKEIYGGPASIDLLAASECMVQAIERCPNLRSISVGDLDASSSKRITAALMRLERLSTLLYWETYNERGILLNPSSLARILTLSTLRTVDLALFWQPDMFKAMELEELHGAATHIETLSLWQGRAVDEFAPNFNAEVLRLLSGVPTSSSSLMSPNLPHSYPSAASPSLRTLTLDSAQLGPEPYYPPWLLSTLPTFSNLQSLKLPLYDLESLLFSLPSSIHRLMLTVDTQDDSSRLETGDLQYVLQNLPTRLPSSIKVLELALEGEDRGELKPEGVECAVHAFRANGVELRFAGQDTPLLVLDIDLCECLLSHREALSTFSDSAFSSFSSEKGLAQSS